MSALQPGDPEKQALRFHASVDAGGTKTHIVITTMEGRVVFDRRLPGGDQFTLGYRGLPAFLRTLQEHIESVVGRGLRRTGVVLGLPGYGDSPRWTEKVDRQVSRSFKCRVLLFNDVRLALEAAVGNEDGLVVLSGTGSMAWGKRGDGVEARAGGWGPDFGDEGSAYVIGRMALAAASRYIDGLGVRTRLVESILEALEVRSLAEVIDLLNAHRSSVRSTVASLATVVDHDATDGDKVARDILLGAAQQLVELGKTVHRRLHLSAKDRTAFVGGTFTSRILRSAFIRGIVEAGMAEPSVSAIPPAVGGLMLAKRISDWTVGD